MKNECAAKFPSIYLTLCCLTFPAIAQTKAVKPLAEYDAVIVEAVALEENPKLAKFPAGCDTDLQKKIVADLQKKSVFPEVIDGTRQSGQEAPPAKIPASGKRLILSITIIDFDPGSKLLRHTIGWGTGATRIKARFAFRDAVTGREVFDHTQQGKFWGFFTVYGSGKNYPVNEASGDIVDGLIKAINKNR